MQTKENTFRPNNLTEYQVLTEFLDAWKTKHYTRMLEFCQITWRFNEKDPEDTLQKFFGQKDLMDYNVDKSNTFYSHKSCLCKIQLGIRFYYVNAIYSAKCVATLVREQAAYTPSVSGNWGVNPISMLKQTLRKEAGK